MDKPRVKPLNFRTVADGRMALTPVGPYRILEQPDGLFDVMFDGCLVNQRKKGEAFSSYEAAEIWAQTRHEKQILACVEAIEPAPVSVQETARVLMQNKAARDTAFNAFWDVSQKHSLEATNRAGARYSITGNVVNEMWYAALIALADTGEDE